MYILHYICYILVIYISFIAAQSCRTTKGENSQCMSINDCKPLLFIYQKNITKRTSEESTLLKNSYCTQDPAKVCCPPIKDCVTPDGRPGKCIGLYQCDHIVEFLSGANKTQYIDYVRNSICTGPEERSVCCGPKPNVLPTTSKPVKTHVCSKSMTALPPDPKSGCCGVDSSSGNKIIGGSEAKIDQYPWLVVIEYIKLGEMKLLCGGALISGKFVLTAGHCIKGAILGEGTPKFVRLGEFNTTNDGQDCIPTDGGGTDCTDAMIKAPIEKTIPHPEYMPFDPQRKHDIGLIKLKTIAPFTDFIRPICLPTVDYTISPPENFSFFVAGWGRYIQEPTYRRSSKVKLHVDVPYVPRERCQMAQRSLNNKVEVVLWKGHLCAGGELGKDSCRGDSGGPLMYAKERTYEAIGLVSFGPELCGQLNIPGVYTNVYEYLPWIKSTIEAES